MEIGLEVAQRPPVLGRGDGHRCLFAEIIDRRFHGYFERLGQLGQLDVGVAGEWRGLLRRLRSRQRGRLFDGFLESLSLGDVAKDHQR